MNQVNLRGNGSRSATLIKMIIFYYSIIFVRRGTSARVTAPLTLVSAASPTILPATSTGKWWAHFIFRYFKFLMHWAKSNLNLCTKTEFVTQLERADGTALYTVYCTVYRIWLALHSVLYSVQNMTGFCLHMYIWLSKYDLMQRFRLFLESVETERSPPHSCDVAVLSLLKLGSCENMQFRNYLYPVASK